MGYADITDVQGQDSGRRTFTGSTNPSASQVTGYIERTAAELDSILRGRGYQLPIPTVATSALELLRHGNTLGAAAMLSQGAPTPGGRRAPATELWLSFKKALMAGTYELDAPKNPSNAVTRSPPAGTAMFRLDPDGSDRTSQF